MSKLKKGMYIRSGKGIIDKIHRYDIKDNYIVCSNNRENFIIDTVVKSSHDIIDLIEEGDLVNGNEVDHIKNNKLGFRFDRCACGSYEIEGKNIKTIITHEQLKEMEYVISNE